MEISGIGKKKALGYILGKFPSPTETFIKNEIEALSSRFEIVIYAFSGEKIPGERQGVSVYRIPSPLSWRSVKDFFSSNAITNFRMIGVLIRENGIRRGLSIFHKTSAIRRMLPRHDIAHLHSHFAGRPSDVAWALSRFNGTPFSFSVHAHDIFCAPHRLDDKIRSAAFVTVCSLYGKNYLIGRIPSDLHSKLHLVYHGIVIHQWTYREPMFDKAEVTLVSVGRLVEKKGYMDSLEAVAILKRKLPSVRYHIFGAGPLKKALKEKCRQLDLTDNVCFEGWKAQAVIRGFYRSRTSILLNSSTYATDGDSDGIPNILLEAMASGVPVVSTAVAGIPELLNDKNSMVVEPNDPSAMAEAVLGLLRDPDLTLQLTRSARRDAEEWDTSRHITGLRCLFENAINGY